jgi:hypothetical protein
VRDEERPLSALWDTQGGMDGDCGEAASDTGDIPHNLRAVRTG